MSKRCLCVGKKNGSFVFFERWLPSLGSGKCVRLFFWVVANLWITQIEKTIPPQNKPYFVK